MMRWKQFLYGLICVALVVGTGFAPAQSSVSLKRTPLVVPGVGLTLVPQSATGVYAFVDVNVATMETEAILPHQTVVVAGKRIVALGPVEQIAIPTTATRIVGADKYLMPGLADMHVHIKKKFYLLLLLANGVTTIRSMNGTPQDLLWCDQVHAGTLLGPRMWTAGPAIDELPTQYPDPREVETPAGALRIVTEQQQLGYDFLKVHDGLTLGAYNNVMAAARQVGMTVTGHVPNSMSALAVIAVGQRSIEHLDGYFGVYNEQLPALITATVAADVWNCPTLTIYQLLKPSAGPYSAAQQAMLELLPNINQKFWFLPADFGVRGYAYTPVGPQLRALVGKLYAADAALLLGTDAPFLYAVPGFAVHQELQNLVDAGLTPYAALRTSTYNAARFLGHLAEFGTVTVGKQADLLLVNANPLTDVANVRPISGVMVQGRWLPQEVTKELLRQAADVQ